MNKLSKIKTAILIPTYNREKILDVCLSYAAHSNQMDLFDIYVVDNGSTDSTKKVVNKYKHTFYIRQKQNVFIARALNEVFFQHKLQDTYKYIIVMANDVKVQKDTFITLMKFMEANPDLCLSSGVHYEWNSSIPRSTGLTINPLTSLLVNYLDDKPENIINHFHSMFIIRAARFVEVKGFNHVLYPMIFEEPDLGERMLNEKNKARVCMKTKFWHPIDIETKKNDNDKIEVRKERLYSNKPKAYLFFRNRIIYMRLHTSLLRFIVFYFIFNPVIFIYYLPTIQTQDIKYALLGLMHGSVFALTQNQDYISRRNRTVLSI